MEDGSLLLYTNAPWNPELAFIARVLSTRDGKRWVMRRRSQAEMDELVREAGFEKLAMAIDDDGIITVSLARRRPAGAGAASGSLSVSLAISCGGLGTKGSGRVETTPNSQYIVI